MPFKDNRKEIFRIMRKFIHKEISGEEFCDLYYELYDKSIDFDVLSKDENNVFSSLSEKAGRFSDSVSDLKKYPKVYVDYNDLKSEVEKSLNALKKLKEE